MSCDGAFNVLQEFTHLLELASKVDEATNYSFTFICLCLKTSVHKGGPTLIF